MWTKFACSLKPETIGRVHPHLKCKVVDEKGQTVPPGVSGEMMVKGYSVMRGYWNDPKKTAECLSPEGWMATGDLAAIDANGYCRIVGRIKDLIIRGGSFFFRFLPYLASIDLCSSLPQEKTSLHVSSRICSLNTRRCSWRLLSESQTTFMESKFVRG